MKADGRPRVRAGTTLLPPMPQQMFSAGLCMRHAEPLWTSDSRADRERAAAICAWCPARDPCLEWSLNLPWRDNSIYAGLGADGRRVARRVAREPAGAPGAGDEVPPAA